MTNVPNVKQPLSRGVKLGRWFLLTLKLMFLNHSAVPPHTQHPHRHTHRTMSIASQIGAEPHREPALQGHLERRWSRAPPSPGSLDSPAPFPLPRVWTLTLMLLRLAFSGLAQVSGLWPPGSELQAASENLWLEKVLACPVPASLSQTSHGLSRYWVLPPPSPVPPPAAAPSPSPLSWAKAIPHSSPSPCLLTLPTSVESTTQLQIANTILSPLFPLVLAMEVEEGSVCETVGLHMLEPITSPFCVSVSSSVIWR